MPRLWDRLSQRKVMAGEESEAERLKDFLTARVRTFLTEDPHTAAALKKLWLAGWDGIEFYFDLCPFFHGASYENRVNEFDLEFLKDFHIKSKE